MRQSDIKLKNCQIYDENGDPIYGTLEGKLTLKAEYGDVKRLQKGAVQTVDSWHVEVTLKVSSVNAAFKYFCVDQITSGKTPVIPQLLGESIDKENENAERVRISDIYLNPEEITLWEAKADGTDHATYEIKGRSNKKPDFLDVLPEYIEE
ncbi:hypothetical protein [Brevibacillus daliensis]|uniref:hypothetical protein n=1 Tax=Brevibacillus daliensis TaxID=2892995 RepID=UPI001E2ECB14|nr:hypothetical protein [Brevibacillus daliensis]